ncbi:MAG: glycosyltransferase family 2 protein [Xanthomonadaceae bacterium]|jgi:glycosyltransferase involved in cell wall biosynthesis|nr:glycosyltransferase family 2 protein [Xanthomonadaceae bacterium]
MNAHEILPVILTRDEAPNIGRTLAALRFAPRVVVLDSGSTDDTEALARGFGNVDFHVRAFDSHAAQCNHALDHLAGGARWLLFLDADYVLGDALVAEIAALVPPPEVAGYRARFRYCIDGRPLRGALYPPRVVLFRRGAGRFVQRGHAQVLDIAGAVRDLGAPILHDDRKPWSRFMANQRRYAALEASWLLSQPLAALRWPQRVRRLLVVAPWLAPMVALARGAALDGRAGWRYAWERCVAELLLSRELVARSFGGRDP